MGASTSIKKPKDYDEKVYSYLTEAKKKFDESYNTPKKSTAKRQDFTLLETLGKGAFGWVILVRHNESKHYYAMKILEKDIIMKSKQVDHALNEKRILQAVDFPFLINIDFSFKDNSNLYIVMDYVVGGELFTLLRDHGRFREHVSRFYASQVVLALEYLHALDLVHRDIKPENLLIDCHGYIKVADFGFAKKIKRHLWTLCGTPEYLAPEIILSKGYNKSVDWWAFGVLIFEMNAGYPPFNSEHHMKIYEKIVSGKISYPSHFSTHLEDLVRNLVMRDLTKRFGNLKDGVRDIKNHKWFDEFDWVAVFQKKMKPPYVPPPHRPEDATYDEFEEKSFVVASQEKFTKEFEDF